MLAVSSISSRWTFCPRGPVWWVTSVMPRMFFSLEFRILAGAGHLHAAAFAAASGVNLRLDDNATGALGKQLAGHRRGFFQGVGHFASGHGNAVSRQDFLCLILVYLNVVRDRQVRLLLGFATRRVNSGPAKPCQRYANTILQAEGGANRLTGRCAPLP